jgi:hypothetical protein
LVSTKGDGCWQGKKTISSAWLLRYNYKHVNNYIIQQSMLMMKWMETYAHVVELWNGARKSTRGGRLEMLKDLLAWIHELVVTLKESEGAVSVKEYDIACTMPILVDM